MDKKIKDICDGCKFRGNTHDPVLPKFTLPPVKIMFIGENPSWAKDQDVPFSPNTISGKALDKYYLAPLGLTRNDVWITDLIKCRYPRELPYDVYHNKSSYSTDIQETADQCNKLWLVEEILHAKPKIIVTLSDKEVYQRFRAVFGLDTPKDFNEAVGRPHAIKLGDASTVLFPMIHPDISRPPYVGDKRKIPARENWSRSHMEKHIPDLLQLLHRL